jgi:hypothetical protein
MVVAGQWGAPAQMVLNLLEVLDLVVAVDRQT